MGLLWGRRGQAEVDGEAMLAELRQIRQQLERLGERIGQAATRDDLKNYVTIDLFKHHLESHQKGMDNWRTWLPWAVGLTAALLGPEILKLLGGR